MSQIPPPVGTPVPPAAPSKALAIWALVIGLLCCAPAGLVMGIIGLNKYPEGSSGRTICIVAIVLSVIGLVVNIACYAANPDLYGNL